MKILISLVFVGLLMPAFFVFALTPEQERIQLEEELRQLEKEISGIESSIELTQKEKQTLENKISIIRGQIRKLNLQIYQSNLLITDLRVQITDTSSSIEKTIDDIEFTKDQLGKTLQLLYEQDKSTIFEILLVGDRISDFFDGLAAFQALNERNKDLLEDVIDLSAYLKDQKESLESEKDQEENFVKIQTLQKQQSQAAQQEQENLLDVTKGKEAEFQKLLEDRETRAQEIRSRIFELIGIPDAPTFGEAVEIAQAISAQTGIRPAFLLAVLTQESNLGKNVGQCYLKDVSSGSGVVISTGRVLSRVMKPSRDVQPFLQITRDLGRDPFVTPVSCPLSYGYGGAMGPAQFIPSTWNIYRAELNDILGKPADPWNVRDAFLASALYLVDLGANRDLYGAEWCAAVSYFSGNCSRQNQIDYEFYGDSVRVIANKYEEEIKLLEN